MNRIVFFGELGSGKTTLAKKIANNLNCRVIEASKSVVFPISANFRTLPKEKYLLKKLSKISKKDASVSREIAKKTFLALKRKYSPDFIAKALHLLYVDTAPKDVKYLIFSGLRGLDNAKYCRLHNDLVVYLKSNKKDLVDRLCKDRGYTKELSVAEINEEQRLYKTKEIEEVADLVINTSSNNIIKASKQILSKLKNWRKMCKICVNTNSNPAIKFDKFEICHVCRSYKKNLDLKHLKKELDFLKTFKKKNRKYNVLVGISGGKDSTATLYTIKKMGFKPLAFTFNLGYLPETTIPRSKEIAKFLGVDHEVINIRKYIRKIDLDSYKKTVKLYEEPFNFETKKKFKKSYEIGRKHYSVKCNHSPVFVRTCQLCRRMVIRAYYGEAIKRNISAIILGINEWTNLSAAQKGKEYKVSGVRKLQPEKNKPPIYIFHLPFLLQRNSKNTKRILNKIKWRPPKGEDFIESNSNSCLYARSTERMAKRLLEFHPDSTRLAREVTVGFITKKQALKALGKIHPYKFSPRQVLKRAKIL
ncbi:7-cyano-7-deazaguanine synthase [Candidatus Woesearchaeota archaeon]|nr:7-cyano-7-deazaguanine synthase [Candidatus Woesearchaeota archaeon]